ncbi:MAG: hypothetical protein EBY30_03390 [Rhodospirillales bacterium]|nr:hypothetical protein [Rhodospirillales bacterium]
MGMIRPGPLSAEQRVSLERLVRQADHRFRDKMSGGGSGKVSRWAYRARIPRLGAACRRLSEQDGSERQAV